MPQLQKVIANDNSIRLFDSDMFHDNENIEEVHLWQNKIRAIRFDANKMMKLKIFDVRGNVCIDELFYIQKDITATAIQLKMIEKCSSYVKLPEMLVYIRSRAFRKTWETKNFLKRLKLEIFRMKKSLLELNKNCKLSVLDFILQKFFLQMALHETKLHFI